MALAGAKGVTGVWGRAVESAGAPPYWPWRQVLRGVGEIVDLTAMADEHRLSADLARLAPDVFVDRETPAVSGGSAEERFRQFDAVAVLLRQLTRRGPLVIGLDDVHAADHASLLLLQHLARGVRDERLLVVVNHRDTEQTHGALVAELLREPVTRHIHLGGLAARAVGRQLASVVGHDVGHAEVARVHDLTGGNPFFVAEVGRMLTDRRDGVPAVVTTNLREAIGTRLSRLSADAAWLLRAASIVGREFSATVVAAMVDLPVMDCLGLLDEAAAAGLVEVPPAAGEHRFTHTLVRDATEATLGTPERVRLHRLAAEALEQLCGDRLEQHLFDLARHWAVAAVQGDRARATGWIERAGAEAMRRHSYEEGARLFRLALDVGAGELDEAARCRLLLGLGSALHLSSDTPGGLEACLQASTLASEIGRPDLVAQAALVAEPTFQPETDLVIRQLCEKAVAAVGSEPAALRARVMARFAQVCDYLADVEPAGPASEEAVALAELSGEPAALIAALHARQMVCSGPDGLDERASLAERVLSLGREAGDPNEQMWAHLWWVDVAFERGDFGGAAREVETVAPLAKEVGGPLARWQLLRCQAMLAQAQARFDDARRLTDEAFSTVAPTGHPAAGLIRGAQLMAVARHTGHDNESIAANGILGPGNPVQPFQTAGVIGALASAEILTEIGRLREAATIYRSLGAVAHWRISPHSTLATYKSGIWVAAALDISDDVGSLRELLSPYRGHHVISGAGPLGYFGPVELWLGVAAAYLDLLDEAVADLETAAKACAVSGAAVFTPRRSTSSPAPWRAGRGRGTSTGPVPWPPGQLDRPLRSVCHRSLQRPDGCSNSSTPPPHPCR